MTRDRPWLALLGFFPPIYLFGLIRFWGRSWTQIDGGFQSIMPAIPTFWWPVRLYKHRKRNRY